jgi:UDP-N-acetylglucosamine 2-epimerase (non-hydrolysing)
MATGPERMQEAVALALSYSYGTERDFRLVADYDAPNVSKKVAKLILSYTDYVRRVVWKQYA